MQQSTSFALVCSPRQDNTHFPPRLARNNGQIIATLASSISAPLTVDRWNHPYVLRQLLVSQTPFFILGVPRRHASS